MIDLKSMKVGSHRAVGLEIKLPFVLMNLVCNTKGFLCGPFINGDYLLSHKASVCIMSRFDSCEQLLASSVVFCNLAAQNQGITLGMKGQEALQKMNETQN